MTVVTARLPPHRVFFALAGLEAAMVVGVVVAPHLGPATPFDGLPLAARHAHEMVFGCFAAAFAGVMFTALPRWTDGPPMRPASVVVLALLWVAGRLGQWPTGAVAGFAGAPGLSALFPAAAALVAGVAMVRAGDRRDALVPVVLAALAVVDVGLASGALATDVGERLALSGALGLATLMGGRVAPALTRHFGESRGCEPRLRRSVGLEAAVAIVTALALAVWSLRPTGTTTAAVLAAAAVTHGLRLAGWSGATTIGRPSLLALHLGYAFLPLGFALTATAAATDDPRFADAGLHAWGAGVFGLMCGAIQASVVRRHGGRALRVDRLADLACAALLVAASIRTAAFFLDDTASALVGAASAWGIGQGGLIASALRPKPRVEEANPEEAERRPRGG